MRLFRNVVSMFLFSVIPQRLACAFLLAAAFVCSADGSGSAGRDVFNEPPSKEDLALAAEASAVIQRAKLGSEAILHTTKGDVHLKLLPEVRECAGCVVRSFCCPNL